MRVIGPLLVLAGILALSAGASANVLTTYECGENQHHPENAPNACVCDEGYHWENNGSGMECVRDGPEPSGCRPYCLV